MRRAIIILALIGLAAVAQAGYEGGNVPSEVARRRAEKALAADPDGIDYEQFLRDIEAARSLAEVKTALIAWIKREQAQKRIGDEEREKAADDARKLAAERSKQALEDERRKAGPGR
jgi:hypothetical protein